jgi:uncharacterized protein (TIGR02217 family)
MSFDEVQFPTGVAYGATGGPEFSTLVTTQFGGFEQRNQNWSVARGRYDVSTGIKDQTDIDAVIAFFRARRGKARGFRFKDWSDYKLENEVIGVGTGSATAFQIKKTYTSGAISYTRNIIKPVSGTIAVYVNSVLQTVTTHYTIDHTTGIITFVSPPGNGLDVSVDGEFDVPVRFDIDQLPIRVTNPGQYISDAIPLVEVRV